MYPCLLDFAWIECRAAGCWLWLTPHWAASRIIRAWWLTPVSMLWKPSGDHSTLYRPLSHAGIAQNILSMHNSEFFLFQSAWRQDIQALLCNCKFILGEAWRKVFVSTILVLMSKWTEGMTYAFKLMSLVQCINGFQCGSLMHTIKHIPAALSVSYSNPRIMFSSNYKETITYFL